jgi:glycosyltransferase involved in cell wall biosynthesis
MKGPLITVGIPSYNHAKFLEKALDTVVKQTYSNLEIIIVDNFSTDGTDDVLSKFIDSRMSIVKVNNGGSIAVSRNIILSKSKGEWIAFLDSDDWWTLDKLEKSAQQFQQGVDLIYHDLIVVNENADNMQKTTRKSRKMKKPVFKDLIIKGNTIPTSSVVVRKSILIKVQGMNESKYMYGIEDFNTWLKISQITDGFRYLNENLGFYRVHQTNTSITKKFSPPLEAYKEFLPMLSDKELKTMENNYKYVSARLNFSAGNYSAIKKELADLIRFGSIPNRLKSLYMYLLLFINKHKS